jgi:hypothetical protein
VFQIYEIRCWVAKYALTDTPSLICQWQTWTTTSCAFRIPTSNTLPHLHYFEYKQCIQLILKQHVWAPARLSSIAWHDDSTGFASTRHDIANGLPYSSTKSTRPQSHMLFPHISHSFNEMPNSLSARRTEWRRCVGIQIGTISWFERAPIQIGGCILGDGKWRLTFSQLAHFTVYGIGFSFSPYPIMGPKRDSSSAPLS